MLNVARLVYNGEVLGLRIRMVNTSNYLCVDTSINNLGIIKKLFKEDEIGWLKNFQLYLQDEEYKTSTFLENFAMEVEDEGLLNLILEVEKIAEKYLKDYSERYDPWFYIKFTRSSSIFPKERIDFIKKWYYIRYLLRSESFYIRLCEDDYYLCKAIVNYTCDPDVGKNERILLSTLEKFNSKGNPRYIVVKDTYEEEDWRVYDLSSYIHGGEPLCYNSEGNEFEKYQASLVFINLNECYEEGVSYSYYDGGVSDDYDYMLVDMLEE